MHTYFSSLCKYTFHFFNQITIKSMSKTHFNLNVFTQKPLPADIIMYCRFLNFVINFYNSDFDDERFWIVIYPVLCSYPVTQWSNSDKRFGPIEFKPKAREEGVWYSRVSNNCTIDAFIGNKNTLNHYPLILRRKLP